MIYSLKLRQSGWTNRHPPITSDMNQQTKWISSNIRQKHNLGKCKKDVVLFEVVKQVLRLWLIIEFNDRLIDLLFRVYVRGHLPDLLHLLLLCLKWNWAHEREYLKNRLQSTGCLLLQACSLQFFEHLAGTVIQADLQWLIMPGVQRIALGSCHGTQGYLCLSFWEHACDVSVLGRS